MRPRLSQTRQLRHAALATVATMLLSACGDSAGPKIQGGVPDMRRLTEEQYSRVIADVFGDDITIGGGLDPLIRQDGLLALGARSARITPTGFERYYDLANSISAQVVSEQKRDELIPCVPAAANAADDACAKKFFSQVGRYLYRRPPTDGEVATAVKAANEAATGVGDFYDGIAVALAAMMTTPQFLFVIDTIEPDPDADDKKGVRLNSYAKASRLSFLLWNSAPDDELLEAAAKDELQSSKGLKTQVERMMASPRLEDGVRAFFKDMLEFELFDTLEKDPSIYPAFSASLAEDAQEQMLRGIVDHLMVREEDYRDLFTTSKTFMTPALARVYRIPAASPSGGWAPYEFPAGDPRVGIMTQIGFTALHSHPGRSSATLRGKALRETLLCQTVPPPPGDVDFTLFNDPNAPNKTARQRLTAHATVPACTGCHMITDPIGLGLENFDGIGAFRTTENAVELDVKGTLDGKSFENPNGLAVALRDNPAATTCVVNRLTAYGMGRPLTRDDATFTKFAQEKFSGEGFKFVALLRQLALSDALYAVREPVEKKSSKKIVADSTVVNPAAAANEESKS